MRDMRINECLVRWTDSLIRNQRVIMNADGKPMEVTDLPQDSPISLVLFVAHIADIHRAVEDQVEDSWASPS